MNKPQIITKIIPLRFVNTTTSQVNISVPFRVKEIRTKSIVYKDDIDPVLAPTYGVIASSLVGNQPLGVFMNDYRFASYSNNDEIVYKFRNPIDIVGSYTFNYELISGVAMTGSMIILLEFTEAEQTALTN